MMIKFIPPPASFSKGTVGSIKGFILLVAMLLVATSNSFAQARFETIDGIRYLIDSDAKTAAVVASNGEKYSGDIVVPESVTAKDGIKYLVTALGDNAFKDCKKLLNVTVPNTVTSFGENCFLRL